MIAFPPPWLQAPDVEWLVDMEVAYEKTRGFHGLDRGEFDKKWEQTMTIVGTTHQDLIFLIPNDFEELSTVPANAPALYELLSGMSTHHINKVLQIRRPAHIEEIDITTYEGGAYRYPIPGKE